jgi:1-acyl-sn-glycerol-3-phosphate acyltransferase
MTAKQGLLDNPQAGTNNENESLAKPPFLPTRKRKTTSDSELESFYGALRDYYLGLPYDRMKVALEEINYRDIARVSLFFAKLKRTVALNGDRIKNKYGMIYTANHIGSFDQFYITKLLGYTPLHYLVKKKTTTWLVRWNLIYKPTGVVVVEQDNIASWQQAKAKLIQYLLHGGNVFVFAEGSRRGEDNMGEFSTGIAQIAQESGCAVCTLAMKNTYRLFSKNPVVCAGETFSVGRREDIREATKRIRAGVVEAYNEILAYEKGCR